MAGLQNVPGTPEPGSYYLCLSELVSYKRVDLAVEACTRTGRRLVVAGDGPERKRLESIAGPTVSFVGRVDNAALPALYAGCKAFLFPGEEDFGITPLEAMAAGRPVIAYGRGGVLDSVADGETGIPSLVPQVLIIKVKSATPLGVKGETPGGVAFYGCTAKRYMVVQLKGLWLYN